MRGFTAHTTRCIWETHSSGVEVHTNRSIIYSNISLSHLCEERTSSTCRKSSVISRATDLRPACVEFKSTLSMLGTLLLSPEDFHCTVHGLPAYWNSHVQREIGERPQHDSYLVKPYLPGGRPCYPRSFHLGTETTGGAPMDCIHVMYQ